MQAQELYNGLHEVANKNATDYIIAYSLWCIQQIMKVPSFQQSIADFSFRRSPGRNLQDPDAYEMHPKKTLAIQKQKISLLGGIHH